MLVKFFKRGNGNTRNGSSVQNYLLNEERLANQTAQLLRGDPDLTTAIIDTLDFATTYTAGCLSFTAEEKIDELGVSTENGKNRAVRNFVEYF